jgi:hypothetical protein
MIGMGPDTARAGESDDGRQLGVILSQLLSGIKELSVKAHSYIKSDINA